MIVSVALLMIGTADITRTALTSPSSGARRRAGLAAVLAAVILAVASTVTLGLPVLWAAACLATTLAWILLMPVGDPTGSGRTGSGLTSTRDAPPLWPALVLLVLLAATAAVDRTTVDPPAGLEGLVGTSPRELLQGISAETVLAAVAVVVALTQTANLVVRAALGRRRPAGEHGLQEGAPADAPFGAPGTASTPATTADTADSARWSLRVGGRTIGAVHREPPGTSATAPLASSVDASHASAAPGAAGPASAAGPDGRPVGGPDGVDDSTDAGQPALGVTTEHPAAPSQADRPTTALTGDMRGGRHIGPVERVLVLAAVLAGAFPVVAGLLAAKGIVRFPEIADDRSSGSKAEEFLVGSMTSWLLAAAGAVYLVLVDAG